MLPQAMAAMSLKASCRHPGAVGYRHVLISNTVDPRRHDRALRHHRRRHADLADRGQTFVFGFFSSLRYTSMNTLVYADGRRGTERHQRHRRAAADVDKLWRRRTALVTAIASCPLGFRSSTTIVHHVRQAFLALICSPSCRRYIFIELTDDSDHEQPRCAPSPTA